MKQYKFFYYQQLLVKQFLKKKENYIHYQFNQAALVKRRDKLENSLTITAPLVALIINHVTSLSNEGEIKEATKVTTQKTTEQLTNNSSKLKQIWILIQKVRSFKQKERVPLAG